MVYGPLKLGAMIEVPAAALTLRLFLKYFDFLSIGTNDLIQYTLAIDRADESVAHPADPLHRRKLDSSRTPSPNANAQGNKGARLWRNGWRSRDDIRLAAGPGPAQFFDASHADPGGQAGGVAPTPPSCASGAQKVLESDEPAGVLAR